MDLLDVVLLWGSLRVPPFRRLSFLLFGLFMGLVVSGQMPWFLANKASSSFHEGSSLICGHRVDIHCVGIFLFPSLLLSEIAGPAWFLRLFIVDRFSHSLRSSFGAFLRHSVLVVNLDRSVCPAVDGGRWLVGKHHLVYQGGVENVLQLFDKMRVVGCGRCRKLGESEKMPEFGQYLLRRFLSLSEESQLVDCLVRLVNGQEIPPKSCEEFFVCGECNVPFIVCDALDVCELPLLCFVLVHVGKHKSYLGFVGFVEVLVPVKVQVALLHKLYDVSSVAIKGRRFVKAILFSRLVVGSGLFVGTFFVRHVFC